jgi:PucR C-terminal helix-turn-helix domain/GGDEF-like domain
MRIEEIRSALAKRLRARRPEIEQAALTRINAVAEVGESTDPAYRDGLKAAVSAALEYGIEAVERSSERPPPMPTVLLAQARLAARHGVKLETVLRRYLAGYTLLGDFLIEESERGGQLNGASLKRLLRVQASLLDGLIAAVSEEYAREAAARPGSSEERRAELVRRLLDGELLDTSELAYDFEGHHLGLVAVGPDPVGVVSELARRVDCCSLVVRRDPETAWAWLGARQRLGSGEMVERARRENEEVRIAIGEPGEGLSGWRLTHRQAAAALPMARLENAHVVSYVDVAILVSTLRDDVLVAFLRARILAPLEADRNEGAVAKETIRAYLAAGQNASSTAAALGVRRHTVKRRLRLVEEMIGQPIDGCRAEIDLALRLDEHDRYALVEGTQAT